MRVQQTKLLVPPKLWPLLQPKRYKGAYGGRGGAKSHFFAEQLILRTFTGNVRAVCIREIQKSLKDSVKQLLEDKIRKLGLGQHFEILEAEIRGPVGSLIIFQGMQSHNAETIKSLEGYDIAWVEEAQTLSQHSLDLLRPTIRKEGSELWFSWNPRYRTDPVDVFFRKQPSPEKIAIEVSWRDNPWFPDVLRKDMEADRANDPEIAEHIWDGGYAIGHGAILARLIDRAEKDGRVGDHVEFDPSGPAIEISADIGFFDTATWWFWQRRIGGWVVLDHDKDSGLDAAEWIARLRAKIEMHGWPLGKIWLPHDGANATFVAGRNTARMVFANAFEWKRIGIVPKTPKSDRINAARLITPKVWFHSRCEKGLEALRAWEYEWNEETGTYSREPLHNWASHDGDGYSYGCQVMKALPVPEVEPPPEEAKGPETMTIQRLIKEVGNRRDTRI